MKFTTKALLRALTIGTAAATFAAPVSAATTLDIGDISIIGVNSDAPDGIAFVLWKDIDSTTVIKFTDNSFKSAGSATASNNIRGSENFVVWTSGASFVAGDVIRLVDNTSGGSIVTGGGSASGVLSGISNGGDQIFAYQGSGTGSNITGTGATETFSGSILYGLNLANSGFIVTGSDSTNLSYLPSELNVLGANLSINNENLQYAGTRTGMTLNAFKAATNLSTNFVVDNTNNLTLTTTDFTGFITSQSLTWDTNGATAGTGGSGTWTATANTTQFSNAADNTWLRWVNSAAGNEHSAVFGGTAGTVTVSGTVTVNDLTFNSTGYTLSGGTAISFYDSATDLTVTTSGHTATIATPLTGTTTLNKLGAGTLTLGNGASDTGANTYTGTAVVQAGTLTLNKSASTNAVSGDVQVNAGASLTNSRSEQIANTATVTMDGNWSVGNNNSETIGTLTGSDSGAVITLGTGGVTLTAGNATSSTYAGQITGPSTATFNKQGGGKLTLTNATSDYGAINILAGTVSVADVANTGTASPLGDGDGASSIGLGSASTVGTLEFTGATDSANRGLAIGAAGGRIDVTSAGTVLSITGGVTGSGSFTKLGAGTLVLAAGNTFGGAGQSVNITAGTLRVSNNSTLGNTANEVALTNNAVLQTSAAIASARTVNVNTGGGTIDTNGFDSSLSGQVTGVGAMTKTGAGVLTLSNGSNNYSGGTVINGGTLSVATNSHLGNTSGGITFANSANLLTTAGITSARGVTLGGTGAGSGGGIDTGGFDSTFSGLITGTGDLAKRGNGTLTLSNASSNYTGVTTVEAGRVAVAINVPASGNGPLGHSSGGDLRVGSGSSDAEFVLTNTGTTFGRGITVQGGAGSRRIGGTNTTGTVTYSGDISMSSGGGSANLIAANGGTVNITGVISGASASQDVSKAGTGSAGEGTVILSNSNTYTGQTRVLNGTLQANVNAPYGANGAFGNATTNVLVGDTLANSHSAVLTIGVSGVIVGRDILATSPGLNTGTATIGGSHASGASTFSGALTLNRYVILTASSGGTVHFTGADGGLGGAINGSGGVEKTGGGTVELSRAAGNTYSGGTTLTAGTLRVSNSSGSATGTGAVVINGGTLTGGNAAGTLGFISGPITVNPSGNIAPGSSPGILTTSGGVSFTGGAYLWELAALTTTGAGSNYDVILMTDGNLAISSGSLVPSFIGSATAPNIPNSFWDTARTWTVVNNAGAGTATGSFAIDNTAWSSEGLFSSAVSGNDLVLNWTPAGSEIPEPSSLLLLVGGGAMLMTRRRANHATIS